eukprot:evm.model.scf_5201.1 EVM.evm.TU.scf_5201.1   scf_5201:18-1295(-)
MSNALLTDKSDGLAILTLNRPEKLNAWDTPMRMEIKEHMRSWNEDGSVRAIIMTGTGDRAFSAGQDLDETEKFQSGGEGEDWFNTWRDYYNAIRDLDKPCVVALNGLAAGSAFQTVMLADVRIGHPGSKLGQPEINSGIASVLGPMLMLPRVGLSRMTELTLTGRMMEADEAHHVGLIQHLVERPEDVMPKALDVAGELAAKPPIAMRLTKQRIREMTQPAFDEAFENGGRIQSEAFASGEPQATMRKFFEERKRLAAQAPERVFARFPERTLTTGELLALSGTLSAWMKAQGVGPDDRVALMLSNSPLSLALLFAIARSGAVWVPVNTRSVGANLAYILEHCEPTLIICDDELVEVIGACGADTGNVRTMTSSEAQAGMERLDGDPVEAVPHAD